MTEAKDVCSICNSFDIIWLQFRFMRTIYNFALILQTNIGCTGNESNLFVLWQDVEEYARTGQAHAYDAQYFRQQANQPRGLQKMRNLQLQYSELS